eukprot:Nk52_evm4s234 gene=Nk52_evmTU4s234
MVRFEQLDGLRGFAAVSVVFVHLNSSYGFFSTPFLEREYAGYNLGVWTGFAFVPNFSNIFVPIFFALSGLVLSHPIFAAAAKSLNSGDASKGPAIRRGARTLLGRVVRLCVPTFFAYWIPYIIYCSNNLGVSNVNNVRDKIANSLRGTTDLDPLLGIGLIPEDPEMTHFSYSGSAWRSNFVNSIYDFFYGMWFTSWVSPGPQSKYFVPVGLFANHPLWTMPVELYGSILVFCLSVVLLNTSPKFHVLVYIWSWLMFSTGDPSVLGGIVAYQPFIFGVLLAELHEKQILEQLSLWMNKSAYTKSSCLLLFVAMFYTNGFYCTKFNLFFGWKGFPIGHYYYAIVASIFVFLALESAPLKWFFTTSVMKFLGKISFPIYLVHVPILNMVFVPIVGGFLPSLGETWKSVWAAAAITLPLIVLVAILFQYAIERHVPGWSRKVGEFLLWKDEDIDEQAKSEMGRNRKREIEECLEV